MIPYLLNMVRTITDDPRETVVMSKKTEELLREIATKLQGTEPPPQTLFRKQVFIDDTMELGDVRLVQIAQYTPRPKWLGEKCDSPTEG